MVNLNLTAALAATGVTIQQLAFPDNTAPLVLDLVDSTCVENNPVQIFGRGATAVAQDWSLIAAGGSQVQIGSVACPGNFLSYASAATNARAIRSQVVLSETGPVWTVTTQTDGSVSFIIASQSLALTGWNTIQGTVNAPITLEPINGTDLRQHYFFSAPE